MPHKFVPGSLLKLNIKLFYKVVKRRFSRFSPKTFLRRVANSNSFDNISQRCWKIMGEVPVTGIDEFADIQIGFGNRKIPISLSKPLSNRHPQTPRIPIKGKVTGSNNFEVERVLQRFSHITKSFPVDRAFRITKIPKRAICSFPPVV
ncbi:hypothetical protein MA16_Dca008132 [Dendrobium catenatum]|uniref:Uncharacterized protein n=1 Tax=Dendrobium catenatum TaxID=906689 RepID=A0A2I0X9Y6_9ASPA|nr:hypothetical protein MA16_Dca008132 [Dendrobium catenatum]